MTKDQMIQFFKNGEHLGESGELVMMCLIFNLLIKKMNLAYTIK